MIWDICMVYNEMDLLELRIQELWDVVDRFGIVEMPVTFSGREKPMYVHENWKRFEKYAAKIQCKTAANPPMGNNPWDREHYQREFWGKFPVGPDDIVTISDCDEIPHPGVYSAFNPVNEIGTLYQRMFVFWIDTEVVFGNPTCAKICTGRVLNQHGPHYVRHAHEKRRTQMIIPGGWHFTYLGDDEFIRNKIQSFSHFNDESAKAMLSDPDLYRSHDLKTGKLRKVEITEEWPKHMLSNMDFWGSHKTNRL